MIEPLPFLIRPVKDDEWAFTGIRSTWIRVDGLLHLEAGVLIIEWTETRTIQSFGFERTGTDIERFETEVIELPVEWIAEVRTRLWFRGPQLFLRARRLDAFDGLQTTGPATLTLTIPFKYRRLLPPMVAGIEQARRAALAAGQVPTRGRFTEENRAR